MNTGIIMIGLSLILLSVGLISSPASAALPDGSCGNAIPVLDPLPGTAATSTVAASSTHRLPITGPGSMTSVHGITGS